MNHGSSIIGYALAGVRGVKAKAQEMQSLTGTVNFDTIRETVNQMGRAWVQDVAPFVAEFDAATVQSFAVQRFGAAAVSDVRVKMVAVGSALGSFSTAYATLYATSGNVMSYDQATGQHAFITINASALAPLAPSLAAVVTACNALNSRDR